VVTIEGAAGGLGATVAITAILFHRLSFIKPDTLLKELLSDCCWYAARRQPSVSVSESITLLSCAREEERGEAEESGSEQQEAAVVEAAVDGSLDFLPMKSLRGRSVVYHKPSAPLSALRQRLIRQCCYMNTAGHSPWGTLPDNENVTPGCCFIHC